jgi:hypothetical protein
MTDDVAAMLRATPWTIHRLVVERDSSPAGGFTLTLLVKLVDQHKIDHQLTVRFTEVANLSFNQTSSNLAVVADVVPWKDRGWEMANYRFQDRANDCLSFYFMEAELVDGVTAHEQRMKDDMLDTFPRVTAVRIWNLPDRGIDSYPDSDWSPAVHDAEDNVAIYFVRNLPAGPVASLRTVCPDVTALCE